MSDEKWFDTPLGPMRDTTAVEQRAINQLMEEEPLELGEPDSLKGTLVDQIASLKHEVEMLTNAGVVECMARNKAVFERIEQLERELAAVTAERDALKPDAERWRVCVDAQGVSVSIFNVDPPCWRYPEGERLIAAIDAIRHGAESAWCVPIDDGMRCPQCGGIADNGYDRELPPNAYLCSKCMQNETASGGETRNQYWRAIDAIREGK